MLDEPKLACRQKDPDDHIRLYVRGFLGGQGLSLSVARHLEPALDDVDSLRDAMVRMGG